MLWLPLTLIAALLWAGSNLIDTILIEDRLPNPVVILGFAGLLNLIPAIILFLISGVTVLSFSHMILSLICGLIYVFALYPYFLGLRKTSAASALLMFNFFPIFTAILSWILLNEQLSSIQYVGIIVLVGSAMLASYEKGSSWKLNSAIFFMGLSALLFSFEAVGEKWLFDTVGFWTVFPWVYTGGFLAGLILTCSSRESFHGVKTVIQSQARNIFFLNESVDTFANLSRSLAISLGPVALVNAAGALQPVFILLLTLIPFIRRRVSDRQKFSAHQVVQLLAASGIGIVGILLIT